MTTEWALIVATAVWLLAALIPVFRWYWNKYCVWFQKNFEKE